MVMAHVDVEVFPLTVTDVRFVLVVHVDGFGPPATGCSVLREKPTQSDVQTQLLFKKMPLFSGFI